MIYLLFDNPGDASRASFISRLSTMEMKEVFSPKYDRKILGWLKGVCAVLRLSGKDDIIVCWFDFQAVLCYWLCRLTLRKCKIVCINLMLKDKQTLKNKVVAWLYKKALRADNFVASVTSVDYGEHLKRRLDIKKRLFLVHDVYHDSYQYGGASSSPNMVFCGGCNGRDWRFMIDVAKAMPDVEFHFVMPEEAYHEFELNIPINVIAKHNIPLDAFMKEMCSCEIVTLPLNTEAPAGLIVLFQAAANRKYVITTDTQTTREYLSDGRGSLVPRSVERWKEVISERLQSRCENELASRKLLEYLRNECSEQKFVEGVELMVKSIL